VDVYMRIEGHGDDAVPPNAQAATQEGRTVAKNMPAGIDGGTRGPFDYGSLGQLVEMGSECAVNEVLGIQFSGLMAALF
jgi:NADH dehydrogenase